jgi:hypothetical protein
MTFDNSGDLFITYAQASGGGIDEISASGDFSVLYSTATDLPAGSGTELPTGIAYDYLTGDLYMSYTASFSSARGGGIVVIPDESGTLVATDAKVFATIASDTQGAGAGGIVDPTPEPGTLFLSGLGLAISLFYLRRKNLAVIPQS